jgi:hypothetical protein
MFAALTQLYFSLSATFRLFQCSIVANQPVNVRNDPNVTDSEKYTDSQYLYFECATDYCVDIGRLSLFCLSEKTVAVKFPFTPVHHGWKELHQYGTFASDIGCLF